MNWTALGYVVVILVIILTLSFLWIWPRTPDGKLMDPDEVQEFLNRFPKAPTGWAMGIIIGLFALLAMIGEALTKHTPEHDDPSRD
jgi:hypothetical protein